MTKNFFFLLLSKLPIASECCLGKKATRLYVNNATMAQVLEDEQPQLRKQDVTDRAIRSSADRGSNASSAALHNSPLTRGYLEAGDT